MISEAQLYQAINEYIDTHVLTIGASMDQLEQFGFGVKVGIIKRVIPTKLKSIMADPSLKQFNIITNKNEVDENMLYDVLSEQFGRLKELNIAGFKIKQDDLDNLYKVVKKYAQTS